MVKEELLNMHSVRATHKMVTLATKDVPYTVTRHHWSGAYTEERRKYRRFLRSSVEQGILKVCVFLPEHLRMGGREPAYMVFIDKAASKFITYERDRGKWLTAKLDRIDWPSSVYRGDQEWISDADSKEIQAYLNSTSGGYDAVLNYQRAVRENELEQRHKKETDAWDADLAAISPMPKDWTHWVDKVAIPENYMFYEYKKRGAKTGFCSYCGKEVPIRGKPLHNKKGHCARCRHEITFKAIGRAGRFMTDEVSVYLLQAYPGGFILREFWAKRVYQKGEYQTPQIVCHEQYRTIVDQDMRLRDYYMGVYKQRTYRWIKWKPDYSYYRYSYYYRGKQKGRVYGRNIPHLAKTALQRTGLVDWLREQDMVAYPRNYLYVLEQIPPLEKIVKANLPCLAEECITSPKFLHTRIKDLNASTLTKALGIDSQELGRLRRYNGGERFLGWLQQEKETRRPIPDEVILWFCQHELSTYDLDFIWGKMNAVQVRNYLIRQMDAEGENIRWVVNTWADYLSMAEKFGIDTNDEIIYRVKLLRQRHDELVVRSRYQDKEVQATEVLNKFPEVDTICQSLKAKYEYGNKEYTIIVPNGVLDIIVEGDFLCHCLRGSDRYWDRIKNHESYILFLRRTSAPDVPYYTLEVEPDGTVRQKRTKFDRQEDDIEDAKKFLAEWQRIIAKRLNAGDRKKASVSRVLREKEFEQMRRDNVIIHTGDLAGRRLVDVLTADLMENAA